MATIIVWSMIFSGSISLISDVLLKNVNLLVAFIILIFIILIGIIFDIIGVSVTAADEVPFHSMAANKVSGAKIAVKLIRNADKVSSFCNDVVGDVCGIVSGSIGVIIASKIIAYKGDINTTIITTLIGVLVGAATIGGKALGKGFAIKNSNEIVRKVSNIIHFFKKDR
ncbi:CNNM domain-containing protein [Clostridium niameyense]|nr:CNNM domain-containing protein [Clostridium niameyense]